jgi:hypothetical protein
MNYGDTAKFIATDGEETRRFLGKKSPASTSNGYKLYGYDPEGNQRNKLEDFGIRGSHHSSADEFAEFKRRIRFYVDDDWTVELAERR